MRVRASFLVLMTLGLAGLAAADRAPIVETATVDGIIHPVTSEFMQRSNLFQSAVMSEDVKFLTARTIYSRIGDVVGWLSVAFTLAALLATRRRVK